MPMLNVNNERLSKPNTLKEVPESTEVQPESSNTSADSSAKSHTETRIPPRHVQISVESERKVNVEEISRESVGEFSFKSQYPLFIQGYMHATFCSRLCCLG